MLSGWQRVGIAIDRSPRVVNGESPAFPRQKAQDPSPVPGGRIPFEAAAGDRRYSRPAADIGIVRAGKACRGFTYDLICLVYLASPMNETVSPTGGERSSPRPGRDFGLREDERRTITSATVPGSRRQVRNRALPINLGFFSIGSPGATRKSPDIPRSKSRSLPRVTINLWSENPSCDNREARLLNSTLISTLDLAATPLTL